MQKSLIMFGGTFDPPHSGHIETAKVMKDNLKADFIVYVPTGLSPHKLNKKVTPGPIRKRMLEIALKNELHSVVDTVELDDQNVHYAYQTIEHLSKKYADHKIFLLIGSDWESKFNNWKNIDQILNNCEPIFMYRPPFLNEIKKYRAFTVPNFPVSSTLLREKLIAGDYSNELVSKYMDPEVVSFIKENKLYE